MLIEIINYSLWNLFDYLGFHIIFDTVYIDSHIIYFLIICLLAKNVVGVPKDLLVQTEKKLLIMKIKPFKNAKNAHSNAVVCKGKYCSSSGEYMNTSILRGGN